MIQKVTFGFEFSRIKKDSQKDHPREQEQGQEQEHKETLLKLIDTAYFLSEAPSQALQGNSANKQGFLELHWSTPLAFTY